MSVIPKLRRLRQEELEFQASLGYIVDSQKQKQKLGAVAHNCTDSSLEG
jgi:hypothetical protein